MGEATSWTDHVLNGKSWRRFGFMLLFAPLLGCVGFMIAFVALFQFFSVLASGESNSQLRSLGRDLSRFAVAITDYLTYNTERKPFPFAASPDARGTPEAPPAVAREVGTTSPQEPERPARRATGGRRQRKTRSRKTTVRRRSTTTGRKPRHPAPSETDKPSNETDGGEEGDRHE